MNPGRAFLLLTGVALLGAIASFNEMTPDAQASLLDGIGETARGTAQSPLPTYHAVTEKMTEADAQERPARIPAPPQTGARSNAKPPAPAANPLWALPVKPPELERPAVSLIGTVIGAEVQIAVFLETATKNVVRLRVGEGHQGWVLRLVKARKVTLVKDDVEQTVVLESSPSGEAPALGGPTMPPPVPNSIGTNAILSSANYVDEQPLPARGARRQGR